LKDLEIVYNKSQNQTKTHRMKFCGSLVVHLKFFFFPSLSLILDEPEWKGIVIEMLLSLYALNNRWIRNAVTVLFKKLMPILTPNSVKLIIDLLEPEADEDLILKSDGEEEDDDNGEELFTNGNHDESK
jgi:hypothetical protein